MTVFHQGRPGRRRSFFGHNTGTSAEDVYICPAGAIAELTYIHVHNTTGNTSITIEWSIHADNVKFSLADKTNSNYSTWATNGYTSHFLEGKNLGADEYVTFSDIELILRPGDKIVITPDTAAHVDTILTVTEIFEELT